MGQTYLLEMSNQKYENFKCFWLFLRFKHFLCLKNETKQKYIPLGKWNIPKSVWPHKGIQASDRETSTHRADSDGT